MLPLRAGFGFAGFLFFAGIIALNVWLIVLFSRGVSALQSISQSLKSIAAIKESKQQ